ncbi:hypothetical protein, partial [Campylobacter rectus]
NPQPEPNPNPPQPPVPNPEPNKEVDVATFLQQAVKPENADKKFDIKDTSENISKNLDDIQKHLSKIKILDSSDNAKIKIEKSKYEAIKDIVSQDDKDNKVYEQIGKAAMKPIDVKDGKALTWEYTNDTTGITYKIEFGKHHAQPENSDIKVDMPDGKFYNGEDMIKDYKISAYKIYEKDGYKVTEEYTPSTSKSGDITRDKFDVNGTLEEKILERSGGEKLTLTYEDGKLSHASKTDPEYANTDINFKVSKDSENLDYKGKLYLNAESPERLFTLNPNFNYKGKVTVTDSALNTKWTADIGKDEVVYRAYDGKSSNNVTLVSKAAYTVNGYGHDNFDIAQTLQENANLKKISINADADHLTSGSKMAVLDNTKDKITLPSNITELTRAQDGVNLENIEQKLSTLGVGKAQYFLQNVGGNKFNAYMALNTDGVEGYQKGSDTLIEIKNVEYRSYFTNIKDGATSIYMKSTPDFTVPNPSSFENAIAKNVAGGKATVWEYEDTAAKKTYRIVFDKEQDENSGFKFADGVFFDKNGKVLNVTNWQTRAKVYEIDKSTPNVEVEKTLDNNEGGRVIQTVTKTYDATNKLIKQVLQGTKYCQNDRTIDVTYENEQIKSATATSAQYANKTVKFDVSADNDASLLATKSPLLMDLSTPWNLNPLNDITKSFNGTATVTDKALNSKIVANVGNTETVFKFYENINSNKIKLISKAQGKSGSFLSKEEFDIKETIAQNPDIKNISIEAGNKITQISKGEKIKLPENIAKISKAADGTDSSNLTKNLANLKNGEGAYFLQNVGGNKFDAYLALNTDGVEGYQEGSDTLVKIAGVGYGTGFSDVDSGYTTLLG